MLQSLYMLAIQEDIVDSAFVNGTFPLQVLEQSLLVVLRPVHWSLEWLWLLHLQTSALKLSLWKCTTRKWRKLFQEITLASMWRTSLWRISSVEWLPVIPRRIHPFKPRHSMPRLASSWGTGWWKRVPNGPVRLVKTITCLISNLASLATCRMHGHSQHF